LGKCDIKIDEFISKSDDSNSVEKENIKSSNYNINVVKNESVKNIFNKKNLKEKWM
jgi:hypothetical protein